MSSASRPAPTTAGLSGSRRSPDRTASPIPLEPDETVADAWRKRARDYLRSDELTIRRLRWMVNMLCGLAEHATKKRIHLPFTVLTPPHSPPRASADPDVGRSPGGSDVGDEPDTIIGALLSTYATPAETGGDDAELADDTTTASLSANGLRDHDHDRGDDRGDGHVGRHADDHADEHADKHADEHPDEHADEHADDHVDGRHYRGDAGVVTMTADDHVGPSGADADVTGVDVREATPDDVDRRGGVDTTSPPHLTPLPTTHAAKKRKISPTRAIVTGHAAADDPDDIAGALAVALAVDRSSPPRRTPEHLPRNTDVADEHTWLTLRSQYAIDLSRGRPGGEQPERAGRNRKLTERGLATYIAAEEEMFAAFSEFLGDRVFGTTGLQQLEDMLHAVASEPWGTVSSPPRVIGTAAHDQLAICQDAILTAQRSQKLATYHTNESLTALSRFYQSWELLKAQMKAADSPLVSHLQEITMGYASADAPLPIDTAPASDAPPPPTALVKRARRRRRGTETAQGVGQGNMTLLWNWLVHHSYGPGAARDPARNEFARRKLREELHKGHRLNILERRFGQGIFIYLPPGYVTTIRKGTIYEFETVCDTIYRGLPDLAACCRLAVQAVDIISNRRPLVLPGEEASPAAPSGLLLKVRSLVQKTFSLVWYEGDAPRITSADDDVTVASTTAGGSPPCTPTPVGGRGDARDSDT